VELGSEDTVNYRRLAHARGPDDQKMRILFLLLELVQCCANGILYLLVEFLRHGRSFGRRDSKHRSAVPQNPLLYVPTQPARELKADLKTAGIPEETPEGKMDFHALRTTFATLLVETGASVKELQTALRHSTPQLSMNVYARARENRMSEVSEAIGKAVLNRGKEPAVPQQEGKTE
jgi:integrase